MARTRKNKRREEEEEIENAFELPPETRRGVIIVLLLALAALFFLSFFHVGGALGGLIEYWLSVLVGWDRFLLPIILIVIAASRVFPERGMLSAWNYAGFVCFFLSFNSLLNVLLVHRDKPFTTDLGMAGGWLREILART